MSQALWQKILEESVKELQGPAFSAGDQFGTVESLSRRYNVSAITARRVLSELASAGYVKNIPRRGSVVVSRGASPCPIRFCFLPPDRLQLNPVPYALKQQGLFTAAVTHGIQLEIVSLDQLPELGANGRPVILFSLWNSMHIPTQVFFLTLRDNVFPVSIGTHPEHCVRGIQISYDSVQTMQRMVDNFVAANSTRIAYLGPCTDACFGPRFQGYVSGLAANGIPFQLPLVFNANNLNCQHVFSRADDLLLLHPNELLTWLDDVRPDAICTPGTEYANLLVQIMEENGSSWRGRIATMGCGTKRHPAVDLYRSDSFRVGELAMETVLKMLRPDGTLAVPEQLLYLVSSVYEPCNSCLETYLKTKTQRSQSCPSPVAN